MPGHKKKTARPRARPKSSEDPFVIFEALRRKYGRRLTMAEIEKTTEEQYEQRFRRAGLHLINTSRRRK